MNSAKPKPVAEINLEEFERRLRASVAPQAGVEDPLAELTRLVDTIGLERAPSERALEIERALNLKPKPELRIAPPLPRRAPDPLPRRAPDPPRAPEPAPPRATEPLPPRATEPLPRAAEPAPAVAPLEPPPLAAAEPAPPPPLADAEPPLRPSFDSEDMDSSAIAPPAPSLAEPEDDARIVQAPARAPHWGMKIGGLISAAVVLTGAYVVFKVGAHSHSGAPPLILASTAPTKVPPPSEATVRTPNESGALLTRDSAQPTPTPPKLVDTPEAPVDLSARPEPSASIPPPSSESADALAPTASESAASAPPSPEESAATPAPTASAVAAVPAPAASVAAPADGSPVALSSDTPIVTAIGPKETPVSPVGDDPSRVKTISVRPDGTLISSGYEAAAPAAEAPPAAPAPALKQTDAEGEAASPPVDLPTKLSPPKSAARVVSKTETTAPADTGSGPAPTAPKPKKPKPVAEADTNTNTNTDDADAQAPAGGGGFAVQLAAPKSESEAKALIKRLQSRFADALGGTALGMRKAERHGEPIYRVRALGLSKADAAAMCAKIKAAGGDCYVAKN